jgi:hypothetical protein
VPRIDWKRGQLVLSYWNVSSIEKEMCVYALVNFLRPRGYPVVLDDGWQRWDLCVRGGVGTRARIYVLVQHHGGLQRQVDVGLQLRPNSAACIALGALGVGGGIAAGAGALSLALGLVGAALVGCLLLAERGLRLGRTLHHALEYAYHDLPLAPLVGATNREDRLARGGARLMEWFFAR